MDNLGGGGVPNLEIETETQPPQRGEKRKSDPMEGDRLREQESKQMARWMLDMVVNKMFTEHDCGFSRACPGWWREMMCERICLENKIEQ